MVSPQPEPAVAGHRHREGERERERELHHSVQSRAWRNDSPKYMASTSSTSLAPDKCRQPVTARIETPRGGQHPSMAGHLCHAQRTSRMRLCLHRLRPSCRVNQF